MSLGEEVICVLQALLESHDLECIEILASAAEYGLALACVFLPLIYMRAYLRQSTGITARDAFKKRIIRRPHSKLSI